MRKKYVENTRYYSFLETLASLPDSVSTEAYYFKEFKYSDVFLTVMRFNDPLHFTFLLYKKPLLTRVSFSTSVLVGQTDIDISVFELCMFDSSITTLKDFLSNILYKHDKVFYKILDDLFYTDRPSN